MNTSLTSYSPKTTSVTLIITKILASEEVVIFRVDIFSKNLGTYFKCPHSLFEY